ncbi:cytochrome c/c1 heme lyase-domain-containing protein [Ochromonadaceae sp. CCMP2298]|nr:cytochrome c/c1 heme lyase-domain-containing protein [Ochromonadaceae sp. CCMP2298]
MDTVIAIHNNMNEGTWAQVLEWEQLHTAADASRAAKLLKFIGRPDEYSPKARLKMLFGHPAPFDRHDWTVDRGGTEVRYVIDYYHDESAVQQDKTPQHMLDPSMRSIQVDVRPAMDSPQSLLDRLLLMPFRQLQGRTGLRPPPFFAPRAMLRAEEGKFERIKSDWGQIEAKCLPRKLALKACASEEACRAASVALQLCTASVVCPSVGGGAAYGQVVQCLELFEQESRKAMGGKEQQ